MNLRLPHALLIYLALLAGSLLNVAHARAHADLDSHPSHGIEAACLYCLHAPGSDGAPLVADPRLPSVSVDDDRRIAFAHVPRKSAAPQPYLIRGPPHRVG